MLCTSPPKWIKKIPHWNYYYDDAWWLWPKRRANCCIAKRWNWVGLRLYYYHIITSRHDFRCNGKGGITPRSISTCANSRAIERSPLHLNRRWLWFNWDKLKAAAITFNCNNRIRGVISPLLHTKYVARHSEITCTLTTDDLIAAIRIRCTRPD